MARSGNNRYLGGLRRFIGVSHIEPELSVLGHCLLSDKLSVTDLVIIIVPQTEIDMSFIVFQVIRIAYIINRLRSIFIPSFQSGGTGSRKRTSKLGTVFGALSISFIITDEQVAGSNPYQWHTAQSNHLSGFPAYRLFLFRAGARITAACQRRGHSVVSGRPIGICSVRVRIPTLLKGSCGILRPGIEV